MNCYFFATVFFIVSLQQIFAKKPTDSNLARAVIQPLLEVKPPKPFAVTKREGEEWPCCLKWFDGRHIRR